MLPPATHRDEKTLFTKGLRAAIRKAQSKNESDRTQMLVELIFMFFNKE